MWIQAYSRCVMWAVRLLGSINPQRRGSAAPTTEAHRSPSDYRLPLRTIAKLGAAVVLQVALSPTWILVWLVAGGCGGWPCVQVGMVH